MAIDAMKFSKLSYSTKEELEEYTCSLCEALYLESKEFLNQFSEEYLEDGNLFNHKVSFSTFQNDDDKLLVIAFSGTKTNIQLIFEAVFTTYSKPFNVNLESQYQELFVSGYFYEAYYLLNEQMIAQVHNLRKKNPSYKVMITGHSLGGALATLAAFELVNAGHIDANDLIIYTFGSPRVGNEEFADEFDRTIKNSFRVVRDKDPIPHMPETEAGSALNLWPAYHVGVQVFYNDDMTSYRLCENEDKTCANQYYMIQVMANVNHHTYFGIE